ncbi:MAG: ribonuclease H [Myxococcota bacterium]
MPWIQRKLRNSTVYVRVDESGEPMTDSDGRVDIRYKATAATKLYRAALRNLRKTGKASHEVPQDLPEAEGGHAESKSKDKGGSNGAGGRSRRSSAGALTAPDPSSYPDDAVVVYTDGACTGNPGPAGIGVVIMDGDKRRELSEYLGQGTNNIAELTAIARALEELGEARERAVIIHSDSSYSLGLLTKNWKAKANAELVAHLRALVKSFTKLQFVKVKGHAGIPENERADELARNAVERRC